MKILLVEDDIKSAQLFVRILQTEGYEPIHTASALEGLKLIRQHTFGLILLDINLPDLDGATLGLAMRKVLPVTPIVALTAKADSITRSKTKAFGFNGFIAKPCTDEDLLDTIRELVRVRENNP